MTLTPTLTLASTPLSAEILTLVLPVGVLIAVGIYWWMLLRRRAPGSRSQNGQ